MMKKIILFITLTVLCFTECYAQGINFGSETYANALKRAKKEKKIIFIDVYTAWCGPCKFMSDKVFTQKEVGDFYNSNFICLKFDAEKSEDGKLIAETFKVTGYPTMLFVNGDNKLVNRIVGGKNEEMFIETGKQAVKCFKLLPNLEKMDKKYEKGERAKEFLNQYLTLKDLTGADVGDILTDYLRQVTDAELIDSTNIVRIKKLTNYDRQISKRILSQLKSQKETMEKKSFDIMNKGYATYLTTAITEASKNDDKFTFDAIIADRREFFTIKDNSPSVASASMGGGNIYMPEGILKLEYYSKNKHDEEFVTTFEEVVEQTIITDTKRAKEMEELQDGLRRRIEECEKDGNADEVKQLKSSLGLMSIFANVDLYYNSGTLMNLISRYETLYKGEKDDIYKGKIVRWYRDLYLLAPAAKSGYFVAKLLVEKGERELAMILLRKGIDKGATAFGTEEIDIEKATEMYKKLQSN